VKITKSLITINTHL